MTPRLLLIERNPLGPRLYLVGQRVHHGAAAVVLIPLVRGRRRLLAVALLLTLHDLHDARIWFRRESPPKPLDP